MPSLFRFDLSMFDGMLGLDLGLSTSRTQANTGRLGSSSFYVSSQAASSSSACEPISWLGLDSEMLASLIEQFIFLFIATDRLTSQTIASIPFLYMLVQALFSSASEVVQNEASRQ